MRRAALLALAALPLLGFDCGGEDPSPAGCTVTVRGEVSETVGCVVNAVDLAPGFSLQLVLFRGTPLNLAGNVSVVLDALPAPGTGYGWDAGPIGAWTNVVSGAAARIATIDAYPSHEAYAPDAGSLTVKLSALPPADLYGTIAGAHGTLTATLPSTTTPGDPGTDVTFTATF